ncbi:MAG: hypothetical protein LC121_24435 [Anaerolineae bacterium]|nr:hypothetical protein [Anaerolineae bacterium]
MWTKRVLHLVTAALVALPAFGGVVRSQDGTSCAGKAAVAAGSSAHEIESDGVTRAYWSYVPTGYDPAQPTPLVLSLHGFAGNPREQERDSGWDAIAERENFIVVYPAGTGSPGRWNAGQREIPGVRERARGLIQQFLGGFFETVQADDVDFIRDLIAELQAFYCIDPMRIYVNGMSNGGGMTNRLACEAADVFAAAGMVAGAYTDFGGCDPSRPIPVIAFHGVKDPIVPYDGVDEVRFPAVESWVADWAARDQCNAVPETIPDTVGAVTGTRYTDCAGGAEVDFYSIADSGHTWPGGSMSLPFLLGKTSRDINASETMWAFFAAHPMPAS